MFPSGDRAFSRVGGIFVTVASWLWLSCKWAGGRWKKLRMASSDCSRDWLWPLRWWVSRLPNFLLMPFGFLALWSSGCLVVAQILLWCDTPTLVWLPFWLVLVEPSIIWMRLLPARPPRAVCGYFCWSMPNLLQCDEIFACDCLFLRSSQIFAIFPLPRVLPWLIWRSTFSRRASVVDGSTSILNRFRSMFCCFNSGLNWLSPRSLRMFSMVCFPLLLLFVSAKN